MAEIGDELPDLPIRHLPRRHARVPDAVADMVEDFPIRHRGDVERAEFGGARGFARTDLRPPAAVIGVADLAFLLEGLTARSDIRGIAAGRVRAQLVLRRDAV